MTDTPNPNDSQKPNIDISGNIIGFNVNIGGVQHNYFNTTGHPICPSAPPPPEHFTGRTDEIEQLTQRLDSDQIVAITAVQGMGGIGKTSLAKALCAQKRDRFGAILWADVTSSPNTRAILDLWFSYTGIDKRLPVDAPLEQIADYVRVQLTAALEGLCVGRILVVLDDVWDTSDSPDAPDPLEAVKILRRAAPTGAKILITTRNEQVVHHLDAKRLPLDELSDDEAMALVTQLTTDSPVIKTNDIKRLIDLIGGHPLALEIAAASLKSATDRAHLTRIFEAYEDGIRDGTPLKMYDQNAPRNLTVVFKYSYEHLNPDQQRVFRWLGVMAPESAWERDFSAVLWELSDEDEIDDHITMLLGRALIHRNAKFSTDEAAWYGQHPLLRRYALDLLQENGEHEETFKWYMELVNDFAREFRELPPEEWGQLTPYLPHIQHIGDYLVRHYPPTPDREVRQQALNFALNTCVYVFRRPEDRRRSWVKLGLKAARGLMDWPHEALFLNLLGLIAHQFGENTQALRYFEQALPLVRAVRDRGGEASTLTNIGGVYADLGEKPRALSYYEQALPLQKAVGDRGGEATTLNNIGRVYDDLGEKQRALSYFEQALPLTRAVGDRGGEAATLNNIGKVYDDLGEKPRALSYYEQALPLVRAVGDRGGEAATLHNIGMVYDALGDKPRALSYYEQALPSFRAVGDRGGEATTLTNIGSVYADLGD
ncbi:MAG: tetratricopeptide repeat protein, partial [Anaerolineae bacterium]|nr:tetratricopeptide repeat protein [Anaerolineae bacterium]